MFKKERVKKKSNKSLITEKSLVDCIRGMKNTKRNRDGIEQKERTLPPKRLIVPTKQQR